MSSTSETAVDYDNLPRNIIAEVQKRPALYDKSLRRKRDKNLKARLWQQVYQNVCRDWSSLTEAEKKLKGSSIQKKWKNMKDCFAKELAAQQGKRGKSPKKRKYIHYDSMLFLIPSIQQSSIKQEMTGNDSPPASIEDSEVEEILSTPVQNLEPTHNNITSKRKKATSRHNEYTEYETPQIIPKDIKMDDEDEERNFALMLVPMLRKLNDDQKHYAKVEILNILKKARTHIQGYL